MTARPALLVRILVLAVLAMAYPASSSAEEFSLVGARAMGMGGAGVATTRGGLSSYWNPAGLAPPRSARPESFFDVTLSASATGVATEDVVAAVDSLIDAAEGVDFDALQTAFENGDELTDAQLQDVLRLVEALDGLQGSGKGVLVNATPGVNVRFGLPALGGRFAFSALGLINAGGKTNVDLQSLILGNFGIDTVVGSGNNMPATPEGQSLSDSIEQILVAQGVADAERIADELVFQAETAGVDVGDPGFRDLLEQVVEATGDAESSPASPDDFLASNQSGVDLRGIALQEYSVSYAQPFFDLVSVGVSAKLLYGTTYFSPFTFDSFDQFDDVLSEVFSDSREAEDLNLGIDAGVLIMPSDWLSLGLVAKYINQPEFDFEGPGDYTLDPQVRTGLALGPFHGLTLAIDYDLIENETDALPGFESQVLGGGVEYNLGDTVFLRGGVSKNFGESSEDPLLHAGLGLRLAGVSLDVAAMLSTDFTDLESDGGGFDEVPERAGASIVLSINVPLD